MNSLKVNKVTLRGVQLIGIGRNLEFKVPTSATIDTNIGRTIGRINDFNDLNLAPSLHPDAFEQRFVDGDVLQRAHNVLEREPQLIARMTPFEEKPIDWDNLGFSISLTSSDVMFYASIKTGEEWQYGLPLVPYEKIEIAPSAGVLNYGQGLFEGMKAYRTEKGKIVLFRPTENSLRAQNGAQRLGLTPIPTNVFLDAVTRTVLANERLIPPLGKGSLYIRPLLIGSGPVLGVSPAPENTFMVFVAPVGQYFKGGLTPTDFLVSDKYHRAVSGGTGNVKAIGNYAPGMIPAKEAKADKFSEIIYLDAVHHYFVEEVGAANAFFVKDNIVHTPPLAGTILPGITRDSIITIARTLGYTVEEKPVSIDFAMLANEAFCSGTAAVISPIRSITRGTTQTVFNSGEVGAITRELYYTLTGIQEQRLPDPNGWVYSIK